MSSAAQIPEIDALNHPPLRPHKTRGVYLGFGAMVTIGLVLGGWYVGERVLDTQTAHAAGEPLVLAVAPPSAAASSIPSAPQVPPPVVLPPIVEFYLQVTALGTPQDLKLIKRLQGRGFKAALETTPTDPTGTILIGPYADETALQHASDRLAASGILAVEAIRERPQL